MSFQNAKRLTLEYFQIIGSGNDAIRAFTTAGDTVEDLTIRCGRITPWSEPGTFPGTLHSTYAGPTAISIDPRRSDQDGYKGATTVTDLLGNPVAISSDAKAGRHPDPIQFNGETRRVLIEDVEIMGWDGYMQGIYAVCKGAQANGRLATGFTARRNLITLAHPNGIKLEGHDGTALIDSCVVRNFRPAEWALNTPTGSNAGAMNSGFSLLEQTAAVVSMTNCVRPVDYSTYWAGDANAAITGLQTSDTAVPAGWASGAIAQGRNHPFGYL